MRISTIRCDQPSRATMPGGSSRSMWSRSATPPDLPRGGDDPDILIWAEREGRILVSFDRSTLPNFLSDHLQAGHHSPGVFLIRRGTTLREVIDLLVLATYASEPWEWENRCQFIPI